MIRFASASSVSFGTGRVLASQALPVRTLMKPPASMMRSKALRLTMRSLITGNGRARNGSTVMTSPS